MPTNGKLLHLSESPTDSRLSTRIIYTIMLKTIKLQPLAYEKYDKSIPDYKPITNQLQIWHERFKIATHRSHFGVVGIHSIWEKNWSMKRKTSVIGVTKPLRVSWRKPMEGNSTLGGLMKLIKWCNEEGERLLIIC